MNIKDVSALIKSRRSIFPKQYINKEISDETILHILQNANYAPTHKLTQPWRFKIFKDQGLQKLSDYLGAEYLNRFQGDSYSEFKYKKTIKKPLKCAAIIGICMQRDPKESIPEWEEVAAVAIAVQNMWLSCTAMGIGAYWSSPGLIMGKNPIMNLADGETCLGLFYMGYWEGDTPNPKRDNIEDKIQWIRE